MIIFDTETTGLVGPAALPLAKQPRIIEFCAVKLNDRTLKEEDSLDTLIHPGFSIPEEITRITGIHDKDLKGKDPFTAHLPVISGFFLGERVLVAHNLDFDAMMLQMELMRMGKEYHFPWPMQRICTVEASLFIKGHRMKLGDLVEHCTGKKLAGAHRAMNDVRGLVDCVKWLKGKGKLRI